MLRVAPFSSLFGSYPICEHTVRFFSVVEEWLWRFERYPELQDIFNSIHTSEGSNCISRGDVFAEPDTGPGFSTVTKLLYFFDVRVGNYKSVIVDSNVLKAIPNISEMRHCPSDCSPESYYQQIGYINRISNRLEIDRSDKLEYYLFNYGKTIK